MKFLLRIRQFCSKYLDTRIILVIDLVISTIASMITLFGAYLMADSHQMPSRFTIVWMAFSVFGSILLFLGIKTHHMVIRHFSVRDMSKIFVAVSGKVAIMTFGILISGQWISNNIILLLICDALLSSVLLLAIRVAMVLAYDILENRLGTAPMTKRVFVYGHRNKAAAIVMRLISSQRFTVVGFLTPEKDQAGRKLLNKDIYYYSDKEDLLYLVNKYKVGGILFPSDGELHIEKKGLLPLAIDCGIQTYLAPAIDETDDESVVNHIRKVKIEDLLGRDEIKISMDRIEANFNGKVVMVTGAAGSIGSELCRQLATFGVKHLVLFDNAETPMHELRLEMEEKFPQLSFTPVIGDVRHFERLDFVFRTFHPQVVFHAAAYKHVPLMEENPCEAVQVNVHGTRNVADKCVEYGVGKMVMISTDKAVNPTNIMGCTKRLAELYVQSLSSAISEGKVKGNTLFVTTRFGNVLGSHGSVIPRFTEQIAKGGPVTVTHPDITRFFMTIPEACRLVMEAATISKDNNIFVFDMGESVKIDTLARRMIKLSGFEPDVDIKVTYTGLRPGEKLFEEVLADLEGTLPTSHDRIRIAQVRNCDYDKARQAVDELNALSVAVKIDDMVIKMKEIVPEFKSKNSRFEKYDK